MMRSSRAPRGAITWRTLVAAAWILGAAIPGCRPQTVSKQEAQAMPTRPIEAVLADHTPELMAMPGVIGTYQGALESGRPSIVVLLLRGYADTRKRIPGELEGHPVVIQETDPIRPLGGDSD